MDNLSHKIQENTRNRRNLASLCDEEFDFQSSQMPNNSNEVGDGMQHLDILVDETN